MDRRKRDRPLRQSAHRAGHGRWHVVEFQVRKNLLAAFGEFVQHLEIPAAAQQFQPDLVERHRIAQPVHPRDRFGVAGDI